MDMNQQQWLTQVCSYNEVFLPYQLKCWKVLVAWEKMLMICFIFCLELFDVEKKMRIMNTLKMRIIDTCDKIW